MLRVFLLNAAVLVLATGCATQPEERSFNQDYGQNLPVAPKYYIENMDDTHFKLTVLQGSPLKGPERVSYMKEAAAAVAETEAKRRGWTGWDLNLIQERDQGWMHVMIGVVTRKNPVELAPTPAR